MILMKFKIKNIDEVKSGYFNIIDINNFSKTKDKILLHKISQFILTYQYKNYIVKTCKLIN